MKMLTDTEARECYQYLLQSQDPKDVFIQVLFETGARVSESLTLAASSLSPEGLTIQPLKRSNLRTVAISDNLRAKLEELPEARWSKSFGETVKAASLSRSLCRHFHHLTETLLTRRVNLHALRHTAFSRLYSATRDLMLVKQWAGHKSIQSTLVYMQADQTREANQTSTQLLNTLGA